MILFRIIGVFWLSVSSMFSLGSNESSKCIESRAESISKGVVQVDNVGDNNWRFYSLNDLTSYDILNNIWNYNISRGNPLLLNNGVARYGSEAYIHLVDGGANVHYDYTGFQVIYRVCRYFITYSEDSARFNISFKFDFCSTTDNTALFGMTFNLYRYKFSSTQGFADTEIVSYFNDSSAAAISVFTSHPFMIKVGQNPTGTGITDWWLWDVFGTGNFTSYQDAYNTGIGEGYNQGYSVGYNDGFILGADGNPEITSIFTGILEVGLLPVNVFISIFNFELFGVNVSGLITGLLTTGMIMILLRFIFGGKDDK